MGVFGYECKACKGERCLDDHSDDDEFLEYHRHYKPDDVCGNQCAKQMSGDAALVPFYAILRGKKVSLDKLDLQDVYHLAYDDYGRFEMKDVTVAKYNGAYAIFTAGFVSTKAGTVFKGEVRAYIYCAECWAQKNAGAKLDIDEIKAKHLARWKDLQCAKSMVGLKRTRSGASYSDAR